MGGGCEHGSVFGQRIEINVIAEPNQLVAMNERLRLKLQPQRIIDAVPMPLA